MLLQKLSRLEHAVALFCRDEGEFCSGSRDLVLDRLDPSHALNAIGSPGPPQKFRDEYAAPKKSGKCQHSLTVGRLQRKFGSAGADFEIFSVIQHLEIDCKSTKTQEQPGKAGTNQR